MPLTVQQNGSVVGGNPNTIKASWWNDYHDLLTGVMADQPITLKVPARIEANSGAPGAGMLAAVVAGTALGVGAYAYQVTFVDMQGGETRASPSTNATTTTNNQAVSLTAIPTGPTGTGQRNLYRTKVGGSTLYLLHVFSDNTTTTFSDTTADTSLGTQQPTAHPFYDGFAVTDSAGQNRHLFFTDGFYQIIPSVQGGVASTYDAIQIITGVGSAYGVNIGYGDASFSQGPGLYAYDLKNGGFIFYGGTSNGITFNGVTNLGTNRNGTATAVPIFTGTTTPTNPPTGSVWIKA